MEYFNWNLIGKRSLLIVFKLKKLMKKKENFIYHDLISKLSKIVHYFSHEKMRKCSVEYLHLCELYNNNNNNIN